MQDFKGRVAVVTGAASGIGRALAKAFGDEGMRVVLADVEADALQRATDALVADGIEAIAVRTDVRHADQVASLARTARERFGSIHVVCNNAGVFTGGLSWEAPENEWRWLIDVNVWGVVHGLRTFVPLLLEQGEEAHIVNTASMAGLTAMPFAGIYHMTKHAVVGLSECVYHELASRGGQVKISVLCPEFIATRIHEAARNRPRDLAPVAESPERQVVMDAMLSNMPTALAPDVIARRVVQGIREDRFYIMAEDGWANVAHARCEDILHGRNPTFTMPQ